VSAGGDTVPQVDGSTSDTAAGASPPKNNVWWNSRRGGWIAAPPGGATAVTGTGFCRRTSTNSCNAMQTEDLYCDDELHPSLENDPNMQLSIAHGQQADDVIDGQTATAYNEYPARPILHDRVSVLSMEIPSTGPQSLRSELDSEDKDTASLPTIPDIDDDDDDEAVTPTADFWN